MICGVLLEYSGLVDALDYVYLKALHGRESQYCLSPSLGSPKSSFICKKQGRRTVFCAPDRIDAPKRAGWPIR